MQELPLIRFTGTAHLNGVRSQPLVRISPRARAFDDATELFLSNAPTVPEFEPLELAASPSPRVHARWVLAVVIVCAFILAYAYVPI